MSTDSIAYQHREWLGLLQPVGLVVSPIALERAQVVIDRSQLIDLQAQLREISEGIEFDRLVREILGWEATDLASAAGIEFCLPEYGETLTADFLVVDSVSDTETESKILLVKLVESGRDFDEIDRTDKQGWRVTIEEKFERLLRETGIPAGILWNRTHLRLVYAPRGESSGHLTFPLAAMTEVAGRIILGGLVALLGAERLFNVPIDRRLPKLLEESRNYQAEVSNQLAEQVLEALWELLRGFGLADEATQGKLLAQTAATDIYGGLITTLMRLVFLLYAEDRGLMPGDGVYQRNYAVSGLYEQLRDDDSNYPDTMEQRYGAWAWLLSLFRLVYDGGGATAAYLPARHGQLFDPLEYPFLMGVGFGSLLLRQRLRQRIRSEQADCAVMDELPRIPDGVIYRVLEKLLMLNGEKLSYRTLDVEQIGSVYEGIMGFTVERCSQPAIGVMSKAGGAKKAITVVIDVAELLATNPADRSKKLKEWASCEVVGNSLHLLKQATTLPEIVAALGRKVSAQTGDILPTGSLYLQPTVERRRSGSHYTPRALTQPIVARTLEPIFQQLGDKPTPAQILALKVCDPAMGSGAFLVEACRQLADKLVAAWDYDSESPVVSDGELLLIARRLVAQQCLYGVDKNPFAVNLAKLSLWLVTLAQDLPFTFLDHALKCGDSLVGRTRQEINVFGRIESPLAGSPIGVELDKQVLAAKLWRSEIQVQDTRSDAQALEKAEKWRSAESALAGVRLRSDVSIAVFFDGVGKNKQDREALRRDYAGMVQLQPERMVEISARLRERVVPFNWEIEFPEVFDRENSGFDAIVGNPPFAGKNTTTSGNAEGYPDWLKDTYAESHGNSDLVAFFFRRSFDLLRSNGTMGLIATNTIAQGDTRSTGLRFICNNGGLIYNATRRYKWPGLAAVVVSLVHIMKIK
jgi:hypothetical protein